jgi:hypothetical protein
LFRRESSGRDKKVSQYRGRLADRVLQLPRTVKRACGVRTEPKKKIAANLEAFRLIDEQN